MDRLWAPWRLQYVKTNSEPNIDDFIAHYDQQTNDRENLVVCRSDLSIVILNRFPYNNGHLLVAPRRALAELEEMTDEEMIDGQKLIRDMITAMKAFMNPAGFNVGLNLGRAAGAGLPGHLHWHIVPRWSGDINFMTVCSDSRVIVQSLDELWVQLRTQLGLPVE
ncbi:AP-4-A phosphorylase [Planctomycetes bacterium Pan216]|uniref:AP-4-A phosphorylase n=1 Tax=Kolteria novifilia TaxID=2527975 RepID=A0A518BD47_9BACT|nr:AP-4-A phosphorylase [Planctomycetes bacterium Pan216]